MMSNNSIRGTRASFTSMLFRNERRFAATAGLSLQGPLTIHARAGGFSSLKVGHALGVFIFLIPAFQILRAQSIQEKAWKTLEAGAHDKSYARRTNAVLSLGLLPGNNRAVSLAEGALDDSIPEVRAAAARALGQMKSRKSIDLLKKALEDKDPSVVLSAANSLVALHDPSAYEVFYAILTGRRKSKQSLIAEEEKTLRDRKKMAEFGIEEGLGFIPFAGMGYGVFRALTKDDVSPVRAAAAKVLAKDPDPRTAQALVDAVSDKSWVVRAAAIDAIARRGDAALMKSIEPALEDEKDVVRFTAAAAIIRLTAQENPDTGHNNRSGSAAGGKRRSQARPPQL
jgi:HEAT repeat protein